MEKKQEDKQIFRKSVMDRLSSPEELNDYLHVTRPAVWIAMIAVVVVLVGAIVWSAVTFVDSYVSATAEVENGRMTVLMERDTPFVSQVDVGQEVVVGTSSFQITGLGYRDEYLIAQAACDLADGTYPAKVVFSHTQLLGMIIN